MSDQNFEKSEQEKKKKVQLDSILDAALLDFDESDDSDNEDDINSTVKHPQQKSSVIKTNPKINVEEKKAKSAQPTNIKDTTPSNNQVKSLEEFDEDKLEKELEKMMQHLLIGGKEGNAGNDQGMNGLDELFSEQSLEGLIKQIETQQQIHEQAIHKSTKTGVSKKSTQSQKPKKTSTKSKKKEIPNKSTSVKLEKPAAPHNNSHEADVDRTVAKLLNDMAKGSGEASQPDFNMEPGNMEAMGEEMMESMMKEFEKMGQKGDANDVIDGMMKQLLSKDIMYEPMKKVNDRFPLWLAENKPSLSNEDYNKYGQQYQYFQRIVAVYETEPDNFPRLMELMQDIQEFGQPPADIIKELAPELEFDEEGMPKMDMGMGMPGMGIPGMPPFPGNENCTIM